MNRKTVRALVAEPWLKLLTRHLLADMQVDDVDSATAKCTSGSIISGGLSVRSITTHSLTYHLLVDAQVDDSVASATSATLSDIITSSSHSSTTTKLTSPSTDDFSVTTQPLQHADVSANVSHRTPPMMSLATSRSACAWPMLPPNVILAPGIEAHIKVFKTFEPCECPTTVRALHPRQDDAVPRSVLDALSPALSNTSVQPHTPTGAQQPIYKTTSPPGRNSVQRLALAPSPTSQNYRGRNKYPGAVFANSPLHETATVPYVDSEGTGRIGGVPYTPEPYMPSHISSPRAVFASLSNGQYKSASPSYTAYTPESSPYPPSPTALPNTNWIRPSTPAYNPFSDDRRPSSATRMIEPVMALPPPPASSAPDTPGGSSRHTAPTASSPPVAGRGEYWDIPEAYINDINWGTRKERDAEEKQKEEYRMMHYRRRFDANADSAAWGGDDEDDFDDIGSSSDEDDSDEEGDDDESVQEVETRKRKYQVLGDESREERYVLVLACLTIISSCSF